MAQQSKDTSQDGPSCNKVLTQYLKDQKGKEVEELPFDQDWNLIFKVASKLESQFKVHLALTKRTARVYTDDLETYQSMTLAQHTDNDRRKAAQQALTKFITKIWTSQI